MIANSGWTAIILKHLFHENPISFLVRRLTGQSADGLAENDKSALSNTENECNSLVGFLGGTDLAEALGIYAAQRDAFFQQLMRQRKGLGDDSLARSTRPATEQLPVSYGRIRLSCANWRPILSSARPGSPRDRQNVRFFCRCGRKMRSRGIGAGRDAGIAPPMLLRIMTLLLM
jgi:hypothetical protein